MQDFLKVFLINLICDIDNMLILGSILRKHAYLNITFSAVIVLTFTRSLYIVLIDALSNFPMFQLTTGVILLLIAFRITTKSIWEKELRRHSTPSIYLKVKVLSLLVITDFLIYLDSSIVISRISQHIGPVIVGIFCSLFISLSFLTFIIKLTRTKTFFWLNIVAASFIAQNAIITIGRDPYLVNWIDSIDKMFPKVNIINIAANVTVILIVVIGSFSYIRHHRMTIHK
ncbi:hypothetical protein [Bacillus smithii]|jgi:hypothetical protein|uniref:hypothetical protein n=1 Tax=Bacillus smithii TaxID=1479 RepID=UPI002E1F4082|nr:hypothetical protein [Bacillus smithii]